MSINSETIVQEIRTEFESMLTYVESNRTSSADQIERDLFRKLLMLGGQLLQLFFIMRSEAASRESLVNELGEVLPYYGERKRNYYSIFGKLAVVRPYFYKSGRGGTVPLDGELSLGEDGYSDLLRELADYVGVEVAYEKVTGFFERLFGLGLWTQAVQGMVLEDGAEVEAYYEQKPAPKPEEEETILVAQTDGKGVPMMREEAVEGKVRLGKGEKRVKKKEAIVTSAYTIAARQRTAEEVVASLFHKEEEKETPDTSERIAPQNKHVWATLTGKDAALQRLARHVEAREGPHIEQRVALSDGCEALQKRLQLHLPDFTLVLDFIHANEYVWDAANSLFSEQAPARETWVQERTLKLLMGQTETVIADLRQLAQNDDCTTAQHRTLEKTANYFERNLDYMHYDIYLAKGWPIASGVIEGACRHLVKDRCERSGMHWSQSGAERLLALRAVAENDDWDDFHHFRKQQRHARLYDLPFPDENDQPELQVLQGASTKTLSFSFPKSKPSGGAQRALAA